jgi:hypothetical protein
VEVREGASAVRVPLVVFDEAQLAARVATTRFRAEELLRELDSADPLAAPALLAESTVLMALAEGSGGGAADNAALDVERQLEAGRQESRLAGEPTPDELEENGDRAGERAALTAAATIPAGLAFLLGAAAQAFSRRRCVLVALGAVALVAAAVAGVAIEVTGA